ncbi:excitatory amino acid transporter 3-like [Asterias amurensis]|uniref:excitatory amino acid transporter 3-like n=1 Tax=Asterias amurensis TaxID=7602 RepID=UPI003AB2DAC4
MSDIEEMKEPITDGKSSNGSWGACCCGFLRRNLLVFLLLMSLILGVGVGFIIKFCTDIELSAKEIGYISFPGTLFLNMLKMIIVPLIVSSLVAGMSSLDKRVSGVLGLKALVYYFLTTLMAVILGIIMVMAISPGSHGQTDMIDRSGKSEHVNTVDSFLDLLRNMFPPNIVEACFRTYKTAQIEVMPMDDKMMMSTTMSPSMTTSMADMEGITTMDNMTKKIILFQSMGGYQDRSNVLGLVVFSCILGIVLGRMGPEGDPLKAFANSLMETIMRLVSIIIWISPIGIFFLILGKILAMDDWVKVFSQIGLYSITVISGLLIHGLLVLPLIFLIFTRKNPVTYIKGVSPALMTAFATASSSATLPLTMSCLENNNKIDKRVTRFMLPIGATVNMDGTALYEAVAAIFIAQVNGFELDIATIITVSVTATLASVGAAGIPQAGLVTLVIVLNAVGLPADDVTLIIVIDWFLDRIRTTVNVAGDAFGAGIVYYRSKDRLSALEEPKGHDLFKQDPDTDYYPELKEFNTKL